MKKLISLGIIISLSLFTPLITMDKTRSNQKILNKQFFRETPRLTHGAKRRLEKTQKANGKQRDVERRQKRDEKYSDTYNG